MRSFGFFCFSLALVFAMTVFALSDAANAIKEKISEAKTIALSLEQASLKRFELEQNSDKAIAFAIERGIREGKDSAGQLKQAADAALFELFEKEKAQSREKLEFFSAGKTAQAFYSKKGKTLEKKDIEQSSKVLNLGIEGHVFIVEYAITGGLLKDKMLFASIAVPGSRQLFAVPVDYSNKTMVAK